MKRFVLQLLGRSGAALALLLAVLAPTGPAGGAEEPEDRKVRSITWHGVENVETEDLERAILTAVADWRPWVEDRPFDAGTLEQDVERVREQLVRTGFYEATVEARWEPARRKGVAVHFDVVEGTRVRLERLDLALARPGAAPTGLDPDVLRAGLPLVVGEPFGADRYAGARRQLLDAAAERGYPAARLSGGAEVHLETDTASVAWTLEPGPFVRLGAVRVVGAERVEPELVLGEVGWQEGDAYSSSVLRGVQRELFALELFRSVSVQAQRPPVEPGAPAADEEIWPVEIEVHERDPRAVRIGVGYGTDDGFRARAEWRHRNFFGGLRRLRIGTRYSMLESGAEVVFEQPRLYDRHTRLVLDALVSRDTEPAYEAEGVETGWQLQRELGERWRARFGQRFELRRVTEVEAAGTALSLRDAESFRLVTLELGGRRSTVDSELEPTSGSWLDLSAEPSFSALGSDVDYVKLAVEARGFLPLPWTLVLAGRARLGTLQPFGGDGAADVPIFKRFFAGGGASVRGFDLDELGPRGLDGDPLGGLTLAEGSVELRYPIWRSLRGVAFVDAGQVALRPFHLKANDFFYSAGLGLRYGTPIGPLRFDVARILNPPSGEDAFGFHFSVGHAF